MFDASDAFRTLAKEFYTDEDAVKSGIKLAALEELLLTFSFLYAAPDSDLEFSPCDLWPGYISGNIDGLYIFVPFYLAKHAPSANSLREILKSSEEIRTSRDSVIAIAGSTTFLGSVEQFGDIDLVEYVKGEKNNTQALIKSYLNRVRDSSLIDNIVIDAKPHSPTFSPKSFRFGDNSLFEYLFSRCESQPEEIPIVRFDGLSIFVDNGNCSLVPVSNFIFPNRNIRRDDGKFITFSIQDIIVCTSDSPGSSLVDPEQLGEYIRFLVTAATKYSKKDDNISWIKALKRSLSLVALLRLDEIAETILSRLNHEVSKKLVSTSREISVSAVVRRADQESALILRFKHESDHFVSLGVDLRDRLEYGWGPDFELVRESSLNVVAQAIEASVGGNGKELSNVG